MIKLFQIVTDTNVGGAGVWLLTFLEYFDRENFDVTVVLPQNSMLKSQIEELDINTIEVEDIADRSFSISAVKNFRELFEAERPDIVHTHASLSARIAAKLCKIPVVNTRHCLEEPKHGLVKFAYKKINNMLSDKVVAVSDAVYENLIEDGIDYDKLEVVYNGVRPIDELSYAERNAVRRNLGFENCLVVGIFARLEPVKNHKLFLQAAKAAYEVFDKFRFLIVGTGSMEEELKNETEKLGLSEVVKFTGYVKDITDYINATDINVLTSDYEAMSISLAEGMLVGKPCITTDAGGTSEVVENGVSGIVVPVGSGVGLVTALLKLAADPDLMKSYGDAGREIAKSKFSPTVMCEKIESIYKNMLEGEKNHEEV